MFFIILKIKWKCTILLVYKLIFFLFYILLLDKYIKYVQRFYVLYEKIQ